MHVNGVISKFMDNYIRNNLIWTPVQMYAAFIRRLMLNTGVDGMDVNKWLMESGYFHIMKAIHGLRLARQKIILCKNLRQSMLKQ